MNGSDDFPRQHVRVMQIIAFALLMGVVMFLAMVLVISQDRPAAESAVVSYLSVAFLAVNVLLSMILPGVLTRNLLQQFAARSQPAQTGTPIDPSKPNADTVKLIGIRQTTLIIALALLEGASFFGCIAYLIERQTFTLGVVGVGIFFMLTNYPTLGGVRAWLDRHLVKLADLRQDVPRS